VRTGSGALDSEKGTGDSLKGASKSEKGFRARKQVTANSMTIGGGTAALDELTQTARERFDSRLHLH
jgi:hypothetical protein